MAPLMGTVVGHQHRERNRRLRLLCHLLSLPRHSTCTCAAKAPRCYVYMAGAHRLRFCAISVATCLLLQTGLLLMRPWLRLGKVWLGEGKLRRENMTKEGRLK